MTTDQWWALGRHYGLITPLLDWSRSPYLAAFFPLIKVWTLKCSEGLNTFDDENIAIYRLFNNGKLEGDELKIVRPVVEELGRMQAQRGLFTWLDSEKYFELQGFLDNSGRGDLITKILISHQAIPDGIRDLGSHGIDHRLLFPDLQGAALFANNYSISNS